jgi:hypothetical protein
VINSTRTKAVNKGEAQPARSLNEGGKIKEKIKEREAILF